MPFIIEQAIETTMANPPLVYGADMELGDKGAHTWRVRVLRGGEPQSLAGCAVTAFFRRGDGTMLILAGEAEGSVAFVQFASGCYSVEGWADGVMRVTGAAGEIVSIAQLRYRVVRHSSDAVVDPENVVPSLTDLLAQIARMEQGTTAANQAAGSANQAAVSANAAADSANSAASAANTAAGTATDAATDAQTAKQQADTAAQAASEAAQQVTDAIIPAFSIGQVDTLNSGENARASITGTAKNPVLNLGLPRGLDGDGAIKTVNGSGPDGAGNVTVTAGDIPMSEADGTPVSAAIANAGQVKTVAGIGPNAAGNVPLTVNGEGPDAGGNFDVQAGSQWTEFDLTVALTAWGASSGGYACMVTLEEAKNGAALIIESYSAALLTSALRITPGTGYLLLETATLPTGTLTIAGQVSTESSGESGGGGAITGDLVRSVNGTLPDAAGNVTIDIPSGGGSGDGTVTSVNGAEPDAGGAVVTYKTFYLTVSADEFGQEEDAEGTIVGYLATKSATGATARHRPIVTYCEQEKLSAPVNLWCGTNRIYFETTQAPASSVRFAGRLELESSAPTVNTRVYPYKE